MNDDQILLASAYLDHDVDDVERARAEADPDVMAEVARLRELRTQLRDIDEPDPDRREQSLAAALAAFGEEPAPVTAPSRPIPLPRRPRRSWWGGVTAAAAALVVVVAGAVAIRSGGGAGDDDDSAAMVTQRLADEEMVAAPSPDAGASQPAATEADAADAADATTSDTAPAAAAPEATAGSSQIGDAGPTIAGRDALADFASSAADATQTLADAATCTSPGIFVGSATYDGTPVEVFVVDGTATAVDATTCELVDVVALRR